jgi:phosphate starvation-inducible PhoH-like protein
MMDFERSNRLLERGVIEVAPLAFMRGRTLNDAFVILDEAQNTTSEQMKMFLTRLGFESRAVVTGDVTQIDLPAERTSGLVEALEVLKDVEDIGFMQFSDRDVVRHPLVRSIIRAYERRGPTRGAPEQPNAREVEASEGAVKSAAPQVEASEGAVKPAAPQVEASEGAVKLAAPQVEASEGAVKSAAPQAKESEGAVKPAAREAEAPERE